MIIKSRTRSKYGLLEYYNVEQPKAASKVKSRLEKLEQVDLNSHCAVYFPEQYNSMFHVVNESGSSGSKHYGNELNKRGRKKGVPDWVILYPSGDYCGMIVELKREYTKDGRPTQDEIDFIKRHESLGYFCVVAYGYKAAIEAIKDYLTA